MQQQHTTGAQGRGQTAHGKDESLYGQAQDAMSNVADRASEMWDDAYDRGERYYREGGRAVSNVDGSTWAALLVGGAVGYAIAWMIHGNQPYSERNWSRSGQTRPRYRGEHDDWSDRKQHR